MARPDRFAYRLRKFLRRQRVPLIVAGVGCAAVAAVGSRAWQQEHLARASLVRAQSVEAMIGSVFQGMSPDVAATRVFTAKELLGRVETYLGADERMSERARLDVQRRVAGLYAEIGANDEAVLRYQNVRAEAAKANDHRNEILTLARLVEINTDLLRFDDVRPLIAQMRQRLDERIKPPDELYATAEIAQGQFFYYQDQASVAAAHYAAAIAALDASNSSSRPLRAKALQGHGFAARAMAEPGVARDFLTKAMSFHDQPGVLASVELLSTRAMLATVELAFGNITAAKTLLQDVVPSMTARLGAHHTQTLSALRSLAYAQVRSGDFSSAEATLETLRNTPEPHRASEHSYADYISATIAMYRHDYAGADSLLQKTLASIPGGTLSAARFNRILGELRLRQDRNVEAGSVLRQTEALQISLFGARHADVAMTRVVLACQQARSGELAAARATIAEAIAVLNVDRGDTHFVTLVAKSYGALLAQDASAAGDAQRQLLAQKLERELGWQSTALTLAEWLRARPERRDWRHMPVVF